MAQFTNQAQLTYNNTVTVSNLAVGEIQDVLSIYKTAVKDVYKKDDSVTYAVNIVNSGSADLTGLTLTDDLGSFTLGSQQFVPLTYAANTVRYFRNNILQPPPIAAVIGDVLTITGFTVPSNGSATFLYETRTNEFTPLEPESTVTNTAVLTGNFTAVSASETIEVSSEPELSITKSISPIPVMANGTVTYSFVIENRGNTPVTSGAVITDTFDPILTNVTAAFNDTAWTLGTDFTYSTSNGQFTTSANRVTVDAAVYSRDPETGVVTVIPGTSTLVITGTIA